MKNKIKKYFESIAPKKLGLKTKIKVSKIEKLGIGTGNLNYRVIANNKKFVFRMNMDIRNKQKSKKEFESLKIIEMYKIGPKPRILDNTKKVFDSDFLIIDYIEEKTVDKTKEYLTNTMVKKIAKLLAKIHSIPINKDLKKLHKDRTSYKDKVKITKNYVKYINKNCKNKKLLEIVNRSSQNLLRNIPKDKDKVQLVITQGDFCEQNVVVHKGEYKLIDFEDLGLTDPAAEVTHILIDFGKPFDKKQREIFFKEYLKIRKDKTLKRRFSVYAPLKSLAVFLWCIEHILKIKKQRMHKLFLQENQLENDFAYLKTTFKRALRSGVINSKYKEIDISKLLK